MSVVDKCESNPETKCVLWYLGLFFACYILFKLIRSIWRGMYTCFIAEMIGATVNWKKMGRWAIITGSTDGIGKAYAKALAAKGFDILLISRNPEKLATVAEEIGKKFGVKTKTIAIDVTGDVSMYQRVKEEVQNLDVGVLVNNVGMSYTYAEYLTKVPNVEVFTDNIIKANITSCLRMTLLVLSGMETRGRGVVINVSSLSALSPVPLLSVYSASKAFVNFFSLALNEEYRKKGIVVQAVLPGFVSTNMSKMRPSLTTATPDAFVKWALRSVGVEDKTYGYPAHKLHGYVQEILCLLLPERLNLGLAHRMMGDIRRRYYKKFNLTDEQHKKK